MKVIYVYDALCGWCYGFSSAIQQLLKKHELDCEVVSGGMITGDRIGPIGEVAAYISQAYKDVENRAGVKFGDGFLKNVLADGKAIFTSIPAAIAMSIYKELQPDRQLEFAADIQKAIYYHGHEPADVQTFVNLAAEHGLDPEEFASKMESPEYHKKAETDFQLSAQLQVNGFPTVFLVEDKKAIILTRGYVDFSQLNKQYATARETFHSGK